MIVITDNHGPRLLRIAPTIVTPALGEELLFGAQTIVEDAQFSIKDGAVSGSKHVPSAPYSPPNADTHALDESIHVGELIETPLAVQTSVVADSDHALYMEKGTSHVIERPFLSPATRRAHPGVIEALAKRFREIVGV